jgi:DNA invertase Pin-like site-specific DNA recombinase
VQALSPFPNPHAKGGRPRRVADDKIAMIRRMASAGLSYVAIARAVGLSRQYVSRAARGLEPREAA